MTESDTQQIDRRISEAELDKRLANTKDIKEQRRLGFLKNRYQGDSVAEAIQREGRSTSTGYRWERDWNDGGIEAMMPETSSGRPSKLSEQQINVFRECVQQKQPCSLEQLQKLLNTEFDVHYSEQYLKEKLPELGITHTNPALETAIDENTLEDIDWDKKQRAQTTKRHPYDEQNQRSVAHWTVNDEF